MLHCVAVRCSGLHYHPQHHVGDLGAHVALCCSVMQWLALPSTKPLSGAAPGSRQPSTATFKARVSRPRTILVKRKCVCTERTRRRESESECVCVCVCVCIVCVRERERERNSERDTVNSGPEVVGSIPAKKNTNREIQST